MEDQSGSMYLELFIFFMVFWKYVSTRLLQLFDFFQGNDGFWYIGDNFTCENSSFISTSVPHEFLLPTTGWDYFFQYWLSDDTLTVVGKNWYEDRNCFDPHKCRDISIDQTIKAFWLISTSNILRENHHKVFHFPKKN